MNRTFRGITIDWSDESESASDSICVKSEFDSNVIDERDSQREKYFDRRISTLLGIKIHWRDDNENGSDSIRGNREFDSNEIDESDWHDEKHFDPRISIFIPISIDDDFEKFRINLW
jgi:hypothetical protein